MASIELLFPIILLIIPLIFAFEKPLILVSRRVIEKEGWMPVSIIWHHPNLTRGDRLIVYTKEPPKILVNLEIENYSGRYDLPSTIPQRNAHLDEFCVMIITEKGVHDDNPSCKSKVQWMFDRREDLQYFSLMDLVIPGTHQSAAYGLYEDQSLEQQLFIDRWILCQMKSIKSQLMDGIRYLDFRPSVRYADGWKKYIFTHNMFALMTIENAVEQINEFLDNSKDIVIVSFKEFHDGFTSDEEHLSFIQYLEDAFSRYAHPRRPWELQLGAIWFNDRRLIITYDHPTYLSSRFMWPPIDQYWADVKTIYDLYLHLNSTNNMHEKISKPWVAMAELTHSFMTIIQDSVRIDSSLRHWGEMIGERLSKWYIRKWTSTANIIAVDFYQTTGIVDLAIQMNERRADGTYAKPGSNYTSLKKL